MGSAGSTEAVHYDSSIYSTDTDWDDFHDGRLRLLRGETGRELYYRRWTPRSQAVGHVFAIHGLHEHSGKFTEFAHALTKEGFIVWAADYYGHGQSGGEPGVLPNTVWLYEDQVEFVDAMLKDANPELPVFLHAHSLGSLIVLHVARILTTRPENPIAVRAVGITAAALDSGPGAAYPFGEERVTQLGACTRAIACCLGSIAPRAPNAPTWEHGLTSDADELAIYRKDPWIYHGEIMNVTAYTVLKLTESARALVRQFNLPVFIMHGADDRITLPSGSYFIFYNVATEAEQKKIQVIPSARHEIFHEHEICTQAMHDMVEWYRTYAGENLDDETSVFNV